MFGSLPGAGPKIGPRLLSEIGSDRALYEDGPQGLQCMAGTAPVSYQSGKIAKVQIRPACNKNLRHAMHLFAEKSTRQCTWAKVYYEALRERGKSHAQALHSLGQRWLKIIWKMWQTHTCYDAEMHLKKPARPGLLDPASHPLSNPISSTHITSRKKPVATDRTSSLGSHRPAALPARRAAEPGRWLGKTL